MATNNLQNLQSLRLFAAGLVFVQHSVFYAGQTVGSDMMPFRTFNLGGIGVYIFFIISGFVISLQTNKSPIAFLTHRVFRIYPTYFLSIALSAAVFYTFSNHVPEYGDNLVSMLLFPTGALNNTFHIPYWTLIYEIFFYTMILFLMIASRRTQVLIDASVFAWLICILSSIYAGAKLNVNSPAVSDIFFSPFNIYFICGVFLSRILLSDRKEIAWAGLLLIFCAGCLYVDMRYFSCICAAGSAFVTFALKKRTFPKVFNTLGDYSYGIYLAHLPVLYCIYLSRKGVDENLSLSLFAMVIIALPVSILFGRFDHWIYKIKIRPLIDKILNKRGVPLTS